MNAMLEPLLKSPQLPRHLAELQEAMEAEKARRHRFYEEMTPEQKIEFINGQVILHSPAKLRHVAASALLHRLLSFYVDTRKLGLVTHEKLLICLERNDYEPEICFFRAERARHFHPDQMRFPAPDFVVEVLSPSTEAVDRGVKYEDYAANGVGEYWIVNPATEQIEQYLLENGRYGLRMHEKRDSVQSAVIPGLTIPVRALFDVEENIKTRREL